MCLNYFTSLLPINLGFDELPLPGKVPRDFPQLHKIYIQLTSDWFLHLNFYVYILKIFGVYWLTLSSIDNFWLKERECDWVNLFEFKTKPSAAEVGSIDNYKDISSSGLDIFLNFLETFMGCWYTISKLFWISCTSVSLYVGLLPYWNKINLGISPVLDEIFFWIFGGYSCGVESK